MEWKSLYSPYWKELHTATSTLPRTHSLKSLGILLPRKNVIRFGENPFCKLTQGLGTGQNKELCTEDSSIITVTIFNL